MSIKSALRLPAILFSLTFLILIGTGPTKLFARGGGGFRGGGGGEMERPSFQEGARPNIQEGQHFDSGRLNEGRRGEYPGEYRHRGLEDEKAFERGAESESWDDDAAAIPDDVGLPDDGDSIDSDGVGDGDGDGSGSEYNYNYNYYEDDVAPQQTQEQEQQFLQE